MPERPPRPPVPMPALWILFPALVLVFGAQVAFFFSVRNGEADWVTLAFLSGQAWTGGVFLMSHCIGRRTNAKRLEAEIDDAYRQIDLRFSMLPKVIARYGPECGMRLMQLAEHLVQEGDFDDIRVAVRTLEQHHDLEPTVFEDGT